MIKRFLHLHKFFEITGGKKKKDYWQLAEIPAKQHFPENPFPFYFFVMPIDYSNDNAMEYLDFWLFVNIQVRTHLVFCTYFLLRGLRKVLRRRSTIEWNEVTLKMPKELPPLQKAL